MKVLDIISEGEKLLSSESLNVTGGTNPPDNDNDATLYCSCQGDDNTNDALICTCKD